MAIDINEEVKVWGGFSPGEFWTGVGTLTALAILSVTLGSRFFPIFGGLVFFLSGGGFVGFMVYRRGQPKGLLMRRFAQDGGFLFIKVPGIKGADVYRSVSSLRSRRFAEAFGNPHENS